MKHENKDLDSEINEMLQDYYEVPYGDQIPDELPQHLEDFAFSIGGDLEKEGLSYILEVEDDAAFTKLFEAIFTIGAQRAYGYYEKWDRLKSADPESGRFEDLVTTGQWIDFVTVLGRILARDNNAASVNEIANTSDRNAVANRIASFMTAKPEQIEEAKSLVGKSLEDVEEHFLKDCLKNRKNS